MDRPEQQIHKAVVQHLRQRGTPGIVWWHTPNGALLGGKRNRSGVNIQGAIMKGLGVRAGVSDIIAVHQGRIFALELKAPGGRPTEHQLEFLSDIERAGAFTAITDSLDRAIRVLEDWQLVRGTAA